MEKRAAVAIYARISQDRDNTGMAVSRQLTDCRAGAKRRRAHLGYTSTNRRFFTYNSLEFSARNGNQKIWTVLAAGCTIILKPAGETPLTALEIVEILKRAGVPKGVVNLILPTPVAPLISKILHDPRVRNLSFTGSTEFGRVLLREASDRVIRCSMELGASSIPRLF